MPILGLLIGVAAYAGTATIQVDVARVVGLSLNAQIGGECSGIEKLKSNCKRTDPGCKVKAIIKRAIPGGVVTFRLDDGMEQESKVNRRGKAKVTWTGEFHGKHEIAADLPCGKVIEIYVYCR